VTLPIESNQGVYAEQQNRRVTDAFQQVYSSLSERRTIYLAREHKPPALPNIYEFPREFGKLRSLLTTFLVDLCRPSQLGISPYLRGFYFTGIRPVTVRDVSPADVQVAQDESGFDLGATRMFTPKDRGYLITPETRDPAARKVAQWVYLSRLFPGVILADGSAASAGASNVKLNVARRIVLGLVSAAALAMGVWWIISFGNNRALVNGALDAAKRVPVVTYAAGQVAPLDSLEQLTKVKNTLATLNQFHDTSAPLSYGAFLYSGEDSRESVRKLYYALFRRLLLAPTQDRLVQVCTRPEDKPQDFAYGALRAYLITTEHHARSTPEFLTPALLLHWKTNQPMEARRDQLAQENFAFYARELQTQNDYLPPTKADGAAVQNCRDYLNKFGQTDRIYQRMLADAGAAGKAIVFNTDYPGSAATVVNTYRVEPPFTKAGYAAFEKLLANPDKYFKGEEWVLGPTSAENLDKGKLVGGVRNRYQADFVKTWREYLAATHVRSYSGLPDAVSKLDQLSGPQSPLLQALCVAGENTAIPSKEISEVIFQPVQAVTPAGCSQAQQTSAKPYMDRLVALYGALKTIDPSKPDSSVPAKAAVTEAEGMVKTIALGFRGPIDDQQGPLKTVVRLLKEPIWAPTIVDNTPNMIAGMTCQSIAPMLEKYPFNPSSTQDATLDEVGKFLKRPEGLLWKLIDDPSMKPYLTQFGDKISAAPGTRPAKKAFVDYLNKAANLSRVLFPKEGTAPGFTFTMKNLQSADVEHVTLSINGSRLSTSSTDSREFSWPGNQEGADLKVKFVGGSEFTAPKSPGLWGVWHFMDLGKEISSREFEWVQAMGDRVVTVGPQNHPAAIRFTVEPPGAAQVLRPRYFNLVCVSTAL
jgi:type VI secretion system protein ImpL